MNDSSQPPTAHTANNHEPRLFTVTEACEALKISRWSLYQLINKQRLRTVRIDRRRLVAPADLHALIEELRREGVAYE